MPACVPSSSRQQGCQAGQQVATLHFAHIRAPPPPSRRAVASPLRAGPSESAGRRGAQSGQRAQLPFFFFFFFLGFTDSLVQLQERSRLLAVGYGRKSAASGQWDMVLGSRVRGQDPSGVGGVLGGVVLVWVGRIRAGVGYGSWQWGTWAGSEQGGWGTGRWGAWAGSEQVGGCGPGPSRFVECAKRGARGRRPLGSRCAGCSRPPSSRQPLRGVMLAAAVLSAAGARGARGVGSLRVGARARGRRA